MNSGNDEAVYEEEDEEEEEVEVRRYKIINEGMLMMEAGTAPVNPHPCTSLQKRSTMMDHR